VHTHSNGARGVCSIAKHRGVWLVHAQYEYKLSHESVINGARRLLCAVGHIELWHGAMHRVKCMWNISARYTNCA
jgi:hypothetical protein